MKSKSIIIMLYVALCLTGTAQSSIYNHFSQYRELRVAFVEKYKMDSTTVDVTVIMAQNDDDWQDLLKEIGIENIDTATAAMPLSAWFRQKTRGLSTRLLSHLPSGESTSTTCIPGSS